MMEISLYVLMIAVSLWSSFAAIRVMTSLQAIYDTSPKLRLRGSGFDDDSRYVTTLRSIMRSITKTTISIPIDDRYEVINDTDGLTLKLNLKYKYVCAMFKYTYFPFCLMVKYTYIPFCLMYHFVN